nr:GNAT family N-acetyltransferase [Brucella intermedia]
MNQTSSSLRISSLCECPHFREAVSDRVWKAWWREDGYPFEQVDGWFQESLGAQTVPSTLVAHDGGDFWGTVSLIDNDMDERPDYSPWVAALWVDSEHRGKGVGRTLIEAALERAFKQGIDTVYLCAIAENSAYYVSLGWQQIEEDVSGLNIFRFGKLNSKSAMNVVSF